uniref:NIDO domain-containing protein n=1 Tax=Fundulus heteroclitus TaxID=8078 RepID=A0A3Q2PE56_FUNHE
RRFNFFGQNYSQIYVNHNGHLTFDSSWYSYSPQQFPMYGSRDIIAPYWTDLDNRGNGDIYYVQYTNGSILQQVTQDINAYFPELNFHANWVFIATWYEVAYYPTTGTRTTFQAVLTTNGQYSFVLMNYGSLAGYDTISSSHHFSIPGSMSNDASGINSIFSLDSNVNVPGRWVFRVDHGLRGSSFIAGPLYPYQNVGTTSPRDDDGSAPRITLQESFNFFGQNYSQIFLNNNGDLTFDAPWSSYIPEQFPRHGGRDIIAPFWTDLDNRVNGDIRYVQYSNGPVLQQVSNDINVYFPDLSFHANWVFIATWENVAYFNENGKQTTFQVVLTTDGQFSFVLMNYGSIANTSKSVQVRAIQMNAVFNRVHISVKYKRKCI